MIDKEKNYVISDTKEVVEECEKKGIACYSLLHITAVMYWKKIISKKEFIKSIKKLYWIYENRNFKEPDGRESVVPKKWKDWEDIINQSIKNKPK